LHDPISLRQLAEADDHGGVASAAPVQLIEDEPESFDAKLAQLEASAQRLQFQNLELRLRLQRRKCRSALERKLLLIAGLSLLLLGLVVGLFLGLVVGSVSQSGRPVYQLTDAAAKQFRIFGAPGETSLGYPGLPLSADGFPWHRGGQYRRPSDGQYTNEGQNLYRPGSLSSGGARQLLA
jgi:hypothetical protein